MIKRTSSPLKTTLFERRSAVGAGIPAEVLPNYELFWPVINALGGFLSGGSVAQEQ